VLAPDDGVISARGATVGSLTEAGEELFRLIRGGRLEWRAEVPAADLARVAPGGAATLTGPDGAVVRGTVRLVAPSVDPQTRNGLVFVDIPASAAAVRAGMFARGEFELGRAPALTLPQSAVQSCATASPTSSASNERLVLVDPQPDPGDPAVRPAHAAWCHGLQGHEDPAVPDIDLPTVTVTASLPGAAPAQMETEVARKIENSVATLQGVKHIYTKVQDGVATVTVEFRLEKPTQEAVDDVRDAVSRIRSDLPGDLRDPVITKVNLAGSPILTYTVASSAWTTKRCPGSSTTTSPSLLACAASARSAASAASTARCASSSTRRACWR
jgi:hypothetical protein